MSNETQITRFANMSKQTYEQMKKSNNINQALLNHMRDLTLMIIYEEVVPNLFEHPLATIYYQLDMIKEDMNKERVSVMDLRPEKDEALSIWFSQKEQGIPKSKRIKLNDAQTQSLKVQEMFSEEVLETDDTYVVGYNTGRPAVSMLTLRNVI